MNGSLWSKPVHNTQYCGDSFEISLWGRWISIVFCIPRSPPQRNYLYLCSYSKNLFSKTVPYFWWLCLRLSYNVSKNPLRGFIGVQKRIEFYLPHYKIPQLSSHYRACKKMEWCWKSFTNYQKEEDNVSYKMIYHFGQQQTDQVSQKILTKL